MTAGINILSSSQIVLFGGLTADRVILLTNALRRAGTALIYRSSGGNENFGVVYPMRHAFYSGVFAITFDGSVTSRQ